MGVEAKHATDAAATTRGTGYLVLAVPLVVAAGLLLAWNIGIYTCSDPRPKMCLFEEDRLRVFLVGLGVCTAFVATAGAALFARRNASWRSALNPWLVLGTLASVLGFATWFVIMAAAGIAATT